MSEKIKVGISIGDINGIGMEIILKTFADKNANFDFIPVVYGSSKVASFYRKAMEINDFSFHLVKDASQINPKNTNLIGSATGWPSRHTARAAGSTCSAP
ncbi:MAG: hypothetical protein ACK4ON_05280, partial [Bacteroidia bacterium]